MSLQIRWILNWFTFWVYRNSRESMLSLAAIRVKWRHHQNIQSCECELNSGGIWYWSRRTHKKSADWQFRPAEIEEFVNWNLLPSSHRWVKSELDNWCWCGANFHANGSKLLRNWFDFFWDIEVIYSFHWFFELSWWNFNWKRFFIYSGQYLGNIRTVQYGEYGMRFANLVQNEHSCGMFVAASRVRNQSIRAKVILKIVYVLVLFTHANYSSVRLCPLFSGRKQDFPT